MKEDRFIFIAKGDNYDSLRIKLNPILSSEFSFYLVANQLGLKSRVIPGKYKIEPEMSNVQLVRKLRSGKWEQVVVKLLAETSRDSLLNYFTAQLDADKDSLKFYINQLAETDSSFNSENVYSIFLPDHYFFNWATSGKGVVDRFLNEYKKYWTEERRNKADNLNLTPTEVCVLASIVDGEAVHNEEMPRIAGLYLNRINKGIPMQADPTILFMIGDEGRRRVLYADLEREDPYNTYLNLGLPPGPIMLPDKRAIEAVLNAEDHDFLYMVAREDGSYYHYFTSVYAEHVRNANKYRRSLNQQNTYR